MEQKAGLTLGCFTPKSKIFTASTWGINYPQTVVAGRDFLEEVTCELGFEGLLSDSKGKEAPCGQSQQE